MDKLANTRRRLRSKGTMRRRLTTLGPITINADAISAILAPIYNDLPKTLAAGQHNLTYGEIEWPTLKLMLEHAQKQQVGPGETPDFFKSLFGATSAAPPRGPI